jgi:hypothetical protein
VTFQGSFWFASQNMMHLVQIMVNDYLILGNTVRPNLNVSDALGKLGGAAYHVSPGDAVMSITRVAIIYLPTGTYTFNVGVKSLGGLGLTQGTDNTEVEIHIS